MGISHAYFLGDKSSLSSVFCFERGKDLSGVVYSKDSETNTGQKSNDFSPVSPNPKQTFEGFGDIQTALKGLALVLAQRIGEQEYIFEFMRK